MQIGVDLGSTKIEGIIFDREGEEVEPLMLYPFPQGVCKTTI